MTERDVEQQRTAIADALRVAGLIQPVVDETPVARPLHRAVVARLTAERDASQRKAKALRAELEQAQAEGQPGRWQHEVCVYDPDNSRGHRGGVACAVSDIGYADRGVRLEPEVPLVERQHLDAARALVARITAERDAARMEGVASGRAAAVVEAVNLLEEHLEKMTDVSQRRLLAWVIELIKGIKP